METFTIRLRIGPPKSLKKAVIKGVRDRESVYNWYAHRFLFVPGNYESFPALPLSALRPNVRIKLLKGTAR